MPTTTHTTSARANDRDPRLPMSSASPPLMTLPSPTLQTSPSKVAFQLTRGGDSMIPSASMTSFFHRGSVHDKSTVLVVSVGATALEPPIHRSLVADADIGLGPPTYHPRPLKWWDFIVWILLFWILVLWKSFWKTCFLAEVFFFGSSLFFFVPHLLGMLDIGFISVGSFA